jgi:hypothetical protein
MVKVEFTFQVTHSNECVWLERRIDVLREHIDATENRGDIECEVSKEGNDVYLTFHPWMPKFCVIEAAYWDSEYLIMKLDGSNIFYYAKVR